MARKGKAAAAQQAPKDEVALLESATKDDSALKVDGEVTSSNRKVRISTDSPEPSKVGSPVRGRKSAAPKPGMGPVTTEVLGESGSGSDEAGKKFSPKHKDSKIQPEKGLLKKGKSTAGSATAASSPSSKKRKAAEETDENGEAAESSSAGANGNAEEEDEAEDDGELDFIAGFESGSDGEDGEDDQDSSDDEQDATPITAKDLPKPQDSGKVAAKPAPKKGKKSQPGVIYLGRIPHGFHEKEMQSYFSQFGTVNRLRLSRNKRTGASKHYAFIEFEHASVAEIVSETMDNYLLHGHILQCKVVPPEEVHPKLWVGANRKFRPIPKGRVERLKHNAVKTDEQKDSIANRLVKRESQKRKKLRELGIEYSFDGYVKTLPSKQLEDKKHEQAARDEAEKLQKQVADDQKKALAGGDVAAPLSSASKAKKQKKQR